MSTQSLVVMGRSFAEVSDHAQLMEEMHREACGGSDKRPRTSGQFQWEP